MNASDPGERSTRVEREILEILERADSAQSPVENLQATVRRQHAVARTKVANPGRSGWSWLARSPDVIRIGGALVLAAAAAMIAGASQFAAIMLAIGSAAAFLSLWMPARPSGIGEAPRWRGQRLDDDDPPFGFGGRAPSRRGPKRPPP
ncbi:MAG: hypothetical protein H0V00_04085 [Chloroflexia bacterium]|nr:hypothetical protein [Chloroflexia bacterium]